MELLPESTKTDATVADELRALIAKATNEQLSDGGRYFAESCDDLTRCRHEEIGEYQNAADGELIEWLWNRRSEIADLYATQREGGELRKAAVPLRAMLDSLEGHYGFNDEHPVDTRHFGGLYNDFTPLTLGNLRKLNAAILAFTDTADRGEKVGTLCTAIADQVIPQYRSPPAGRSYSCGGHTASRWQAAYDAAQIALRGQVRTAVEVRSVPSAE